MTCGQWIRIFLVRFFHFGFPVLGRANVTWPVFHIWYCTWGSAVWWINSSYRHLYLVSLCFRPCFLNTQHFRIPRWRSTQDRGQPHFQTPWSWLKIHRNASSCQSLILQREESWKYDAKREVFDELWTMKLIADKLISYYKLMGYLNIF